MGETRLGSQLWETGKQSIPDWTGQDGVGCGRAAGFGGRGDVGCVYCAPIRLVPLQRQAEHRVNPAAG